MSLRFARTPTPAQVEHQLHNVGLQTASFQIAGNVCGAICLLCLCFDIYIFIYICIYIYKDIGVLWPAIKPFWFRCHPPPCTCDSLLPRSTPPSHTLGEGVTPLPTSFKLGPSSSTPWARQSPHIRDTLAKGVGVGGADLCTPLPKVLQAEGWTPWQQELKV